MEFASGSATASNGYTTANQVISFQNNALNPTTGTYTSLVPTVTATFAISNQQYTLPATQNPSGAVLSFGGTDNTAGKTPASAAIFTPMNNLSSPQAPQFSSTQNNPGTGMSMSDNYAVELFTSAMGLYDANSPTNGTYYIADLTVTFSTPITNPVLHIVGLGATSGALGMTTQFQLKTAGVTLSRLSGSPEFSVTANTIVNTSASPTATTAAGAASGSVLVTGSGVTVLVFQVYLRGNGKTPTWSTANEHVGDAWLIGVSALNTIVALPLGTTSFTAQLLAHSVALEWTTGIQSGTNYFDIQRSSNAADWTTIGQVAAAGNGDQAIRYKFVDNEPGTGANYYRFEQMGENGISVYSETREVNFTGRTPELTWFPNPVRDRLTISSQAAIRSVTLTTLDGRTLKTFYGFTSGQSVDFSRYPFGIYILVIRTADGQTRVAKIERS